jgi:hypothetical protein
MSRRRGALVFEPSLRRCHSFTPTALQMLRCVRRILYASAIRSAVVNSGRAFMFGNGCQFPIRFRQPPLFFFRHVEGDGVFDGRTTPEGLFPVLEITTISRSPKRAKREIAAAGMARHCWATAKGRRAGRNYHSPFRACCLPHHRCQQTSHSHFRNGVNEDRIRARRLRCSLLIAVALQNGHRITALRKAHSPVGKPELAGHSAGKRSATMSSFDTSRITTNLTCWDVKQRVCVSDP